ncbi:hypothetical protein P4123_29325 [Pseudomonas aeruginosa]|nr:hypothetical protein [Pseudomonas aeruginosa]
MNGVLDASGEQAGSIRLAAKQGLSIGGEALLDAHGRRLRVDSYGKIIDSPNRALIELNAGDGLLSLGAGARIDLRTAPRRRGSAPWQNVTQASPAAPSTCTRRVWAGRWRAISPPTPVRRCRSWVPAPSPSVRAALRRRAGRCSAGEQRPAVPGDHPGLPGWQAPAERTVHAGGVGQ